ncbi:Mucin-12 [Aspergillus nanangensis]|uniref:Mucin-12 n=1 Tax=Aspergillus nanangensis TaxID=2582783 RepID=A0AAD4GS95_ASPNN|nr:Mucin-12 [Aspergillus nanangensis]
MRDTAPDSPDFAQNPRPSDDTTKTGVEGAHTFDPAEPNATPEPRYTLRQQTGIYSTDDADPRNPQGETIAVSSTNTQSSWTNTQTQTQTTSWSSETTTANPFSVTSSSTTSESNTSSSQPTTTTSLATTTPSEVSSTNTTSDETSEDTGGGGGLPTTTKVAIAVPIAVVGAAIVAAILFLVFKRRRRQRQHQLQKAILTPSHTEMNLAPPLHNNYSWVSSPRASQSTSFGPIPRRPDTLPAPQIHVQDEEGRSRGQTPVQSRFTEHENSPPGTAAMVGQNAVEEERRPTTTTTTASRGDRSPSPFDDPLDDDAMSDISEISGRGGGTGRHRGNDVDDDVSSVSSFEDDEDRRHGSSSRLG